MDLKGPTCCGQMEGFCLGAFEFVFNFNFFKGSLRGVNSFNHIDDSISNYLFIYTDVILIVRGNSKFPTGDSHAPNNAL